MSGLYPSQNDDVQKVRDASDIVRVVGEHLTLKPNELTSLGLERQMLPNDTNDVGRITHPLHIVVLRIQAAHPFSACQICPPDVIIR